MQQKKPSTGHISARKITQSKPITNQNSSQCQPTSNPQKERDDNLIGLIKQFLDKNGYPRSYQSLKHERPLKKASNPNINKQPVNRSLQQEKSILLHFDKGHRQQFFKQMHKIFGSTSNTNNTNSNSATNSHLSDEYCHYLRKLEFQLNIYFCIFTIHPCTNNGSAKRTVMDKMAAECFKKFIDNKGSEMSQQSELLSFFALPYIPKPQQNPGMAKVFTKQWVNKIRNNVIEVYREYSSTNKQNNIVQSNKENKKTDYNSSLQEIYDRYLQLSSNNTIKQKQTGQECFNPKHQSELIQLRNHNREMVSYLDIMQQNLKQFNEASKTNLIESNRKWFQFSKQILFIAKKMTKGNVDQNIIQKLGKYQKFFGSNIDQLIYSSADISLFEKNSYTQDISIVPGFDQVKKSSNNPQAQNLGQQQLCQIDSNKILNTFLQANKPEYSREICLILKALKDRLYIYKNAYTRRQIIVSYQRNDICAIKDSHYHIQKKMLLQGEEAVKQFYLRLLNHISTDNLGNQYLSSSEKLIENLIGIMGQTTEDVIYRKHVFGILQRFSFIKKSQLTMISFGIIPMIFKVFRAQGQNLQYSSIQYLMGLIMNLAIRKQSVKNFEKHKSEIIPILLKYIDMDDAQIKGYVNGTLYVLLQLQSIRQEAVEKYKVPEIIQNLLQKSQGKLKELQNQFQGDMEGDENSQNPDNQISDCGIVIRQYNYILERLSEKSEPEFQNGKEGSSRADNPDYDDEQQEEDYDDIQQIDINSDNESSSSQYIEGETNTINGEELLMKKYALLGPEAVRQELLTRSILDETSRKSHNLTTSINHSKRVDKVFHKNQKETPSLLNENLDLSITPTR